MRAVIQRVLRSKVSVDGQTIGEIGRGYNVLLGVCNEDTKEDADKLIRKLIGLRICEDENGKTNLSIQDTDGELLISPYFKEFKILKGSVLTLNGKVDLNLSFDNNEAKGQITVPYGINAKLKLQDKEILLKSGLNTIKCQI